MRIMKKYIQECQLGRQMTIFHDVHYSLVAQLSKANTDRVYGIFLYQIFLLPLSLPPSIPILNYCRNTIFGVVTDILGITCTYAG